MTESIRSALRSELEQWEKYELNRAGKKADRLFDVKIIPSSMQSDIRAELLLSKDKPTIRAIFKAARALVEDKVQATPFGDKVFAMKIGDINEDAMVLVLERMSELGFTDLIEQAETRTGEQA